MILLNRRCFLAGVCLFMLFPRASGHYEAVRIKMVETPMPRGTTYLIRGIRGASGEFRLQ